MTTVSLFLAAGVVIFAVGIAVHLLVRDLIRRIVTLNVASGGVMLVFLALADRRPDGVAPDPVPQALVLTGIVVMAAITGLALALARRVESMDAENETPAGEEPS
ncbi:NADH-quinone oxidoreductase subunit K [Microbacterium sp. PRF11]|jgi:multicomponent Na+:H+ antiporter subunit C|uniref:NADH-quinone oxidoreductase subunit K n=1 Tax=Microbacterium sp. PRF11 TaxID=2962593 RepID=UPI002882C6A7|nr:NADH-quinone oxidoreductase subunit K [Microbacterium sp. PRF11]MDT0116244.1 NADH-quinone oxidoreductase subunit K [Microbacterium sp. PRF11]